MNRYLNNALMFDIIIAIIIGLLLYFLHPYLVDFFYIPSSNQLENIWDSMISIGATLIGFLLTIITVIITFKKGFNDSNNTNEKGSVDFNKVPLKTIFGKSVSKESQFYNTPMHKIVTKVFIMASYEIGAIIFTLILIQFNIVKLPELLLAIMTMMFFLMLAASTIRSINVFRHFLNVHSGN